MKTRNGFVSNSSSTSFTFIFKGDNFNDFARLMKKYKKHFKLSYPDAWWSGEENTSTEYDYQDIINAIRCVIDREKIPEYEDKVAILPVETLIKEYQEQIKLYEEEVQDILFQRAKDDEAKREYDYVNSDDYLRIYQDGLESFRAGIQKLEKRRNHIYIKLEFGDNHGQIQGRGLGATLDQMGREIKLEEEDFWLLTESLH